MNLEKVLLVEDAADMQRIVKATIGAVCDLICVTTLKLAEEIIQTQSIALVVLDVNLPDGTGFDFCKKLRDNETFKTLPIIFLTGENDVAQRVLGFDLGADDYVVKPFEPNEFKARVFSRLKRRNSEVVTSSYSHGLFSIDWSSQKAFVVTKGERLELHLTPIEFKLLIHFARNEEKIFSREELLTAVWGQAVHVSGHTVDTHISSLRKKVGEYGRFFRSVVRRGYCFSPEKPIKATA